MKVAVPDRLGEPQVVPNENGELSTLSVVYFGRNGEVLFGSEAANAGLAEPGRAVWNWKRCMGTDKVLYHGEDGTEYLAKDILRIMLEKVKEWVERRTRQRVHEVVISVPANYTDIQKRQTIEAAEAAGMKVLVLVAEPTAAAFGNKVEKLGSGRVLVFDFGGGTFDVSIVEVRANMVEVLATNGEPHLGGEDVNNRIREKVLEMFEAQYGFRPDPRKKPLFFQDLALRAEQLKVTLSSKEEGRLIISCNGKLLKKTVKRQELESWVKDLVDKAVQRTQQTLQDAGLGWDEIDVIYAVGGSSRMPIVSRELERVSGKKPSQYVEPDHAAACGGVTAGRIEIQRQGRKLTVEGGALPDPGVYLREVTSHPIGVCVLTDDDRLVNQEILPKGMPVPSVQVRTFKLVHPNQTEALIEVLQGKDGWGKDKCVKLGEFSLKGLPPMADLIERMEITLDFNASAILRATALDTESGKVAQLDIDCKDSKERMEGCDAKKSA